MRPEARPQVTSSFVQRRSRLPCLHVVAQQTRWLLPMASITAVINKPTVQSISSSALVDRLVTHGSKVYSAMKLSRVWQLDPETADDERFDWGLLVGPRDAQVVLLVRDLLGSIELDVSDVEKLEAGSEEPLLGIVERDGQVLLVVDPLRSPMFHSSAAEDDEYPWFDLRKLSSHGDDERSDTGSRMQLVIFEDAGLGIGLPAASVFDVRRGPDAIAHRQAPRLSSAIGGLVASASADEQARPAFRCRVGSSASAIEVTFEKLLGWHLADESQIRPWAAMEQFSAQGAFALSGKGQVVVVVDPERLLALNHQHVSPFAGTQHSNAGTGHQKMSTDPSNQVVQMRLDGEDVGVFMSSVRLIASLRRSQVHTVVTSQPAIVGVLDRTDAFSTIIDLGQLLFAAPLQRAPSSRLVTVLSADAEVTLLVESVLEPVGTESGAFEDWSAENHDSLPERFVAHGFRREDGCLIPLLNLDEIVAEVTGVAVHG